MARSSVDFEVLDVLGFFSKTAPAVFYNHTKSIDGATVANIITQAKKHVFNVPTS